MQKIKNKVIKLTYKTYSFFNAMNRKFTLLCYYLTALFTFYCISWYIYLRFIQERLARPIPFILTEFWFYLIIFLCINYLYAIKATLKPTMPNAIITSIVYYLSYLALPFIILDRIIKTNKYSYGKIIESIEHIAPPNGGKGQRMLLIILHLIPRIILVVIFIMDVFWFKKLHYFYYYLFLSIFPLLYNYHKFTMHQVKELAIQHLEHFYLETYVEITEIGWNESFTNNSYESDDDELLSSIWKPHPRNQYHLKIVSIKEYIQIILEKDIDEIENEYEDYFDLNPEPMPKTHIIEEYKKTMNKTDLDLDDYNNLDKEFHELIPKITRLNLLLHYLPHNEKRRYITCLNILVYSLYIIGWGYILYRSINSLTNLPITLTILESLLNTIEDMNPFIKP